ncbi:Hydrogen peroxide-inducible protein activator [compost metagenome]
MNLEQLECIVEVARSGSLTHAAHKRLMTVAGVSRAITLLEQELGMLIFNRSRRGAVPTPEGEMIIQKARNILKEVQELRTEAQNYTQINNAKVRIGTIPGPIALLVDVLTEMKKEFPNLQIEIIEDNTAGLMRDIQDGSLDAAFVLLSNDIEKYPDLYFDEIMEGNLVIGVSKHSPLAAKTSVTPAELLNYSFVLYDDKYVTKLVSQFGSSVDILFKTNQVEAIHKAVKEDIAITVATDFSLRGYPWIRASGDVVTLRLDVPTTKKHFFYAVRSADNANHKVLNIFLKRLEQYFK